VQGLLWRKQDKQHTEKDGDDVTTGLEGCVSQYHHMLTQARFSV
jgi:hypothetical protein